MPYFSNPLILRNCKFLKVFLAIRRCSMAGGIKRIDDTRIEIPEDYQPGMRTRGIIYVDRVLEAHLEEGSIRQVANVATLPGILGPSLGMPDIHTGYGFAIGGVAAFRVEDGVISPGGVGYDIN
jgi:tRNA-splicing ligase RtcB